MILEGMVTSVDGQGVWNAAPMGPIVNPEITHLTLRPFQSSKTFSNLRYSPFGVFHVIDDVLLLAQGAIGALTRFPDSFPAEKIPGRVLSAACRWYEFEVVACDDSQPRATLQAKVVHSGKLRDFWGFNRAKHAVLEAAILATRVHLIPAAELQRDFEKLQVIVDKTAGSQEREAFSLLFEYVRQHGISGSTHD